MHEATVAPFRETTRKPETSSQRVRTRGLQPTRFAIVAIAAVAAIGLTIAFVDLPVATWVRGHRFSPDLKAVFRIARLPGNVPFTIAAVGAMGWIKRRRWRDGAAVVCVGLVASLAAGLAKLACGRHRPSAATAPGAWLSLAERTLADLAPGNLSFPSGDATLAFATAATLARVWPRAAIPAFACAAATAAARVLQGVHHPSDVAAGAMLGTLTAIVATRVRPDLFARWDSGDPDSVIRRNTR